MSNEYQPLAKLIEKGLEPGAVLEARSGDRLEWLGDCLEWIEGRRHPQHHFSVGKQTLLATAEQKLKALYETVRESEQ